MFIAYKVLLLNLCFVLTLAACGDLCLGWTSVSAIKIFWLVTASAVCHFL